MGDSRVVLPLSSLVLSGETSAGHMDSREQDDDGDTTLVIDESTSSQYPVDLSIRPPPVSTPSWLHSGVTSSSNVPIARNPKTGLHLPSSLLSILQQPSKSTVFQMSSSSAPPELPKLLPFSQQSVSSQFNSSKLPDMVQIASNSEGAGFDSGGIPQQVKKIRKRVLSECLRELDTVQTKHNRLTAIHDRMEYKVTTLKSRYTYYILNQTHDCKKPRLGQYLSEESGIIKNEPIDD